MNGAGGVNLYKKLNTVGSVNVCISNHVSFFITINFTSHFSSISSPQALATKTDCVWSADPAYPPLHRLQS